MNKKYDGKLFSVLGDSISTLDGYSEPPYSAFYSGEKKFEAGVYTPEDTWWGKVINALGAQLLVNNSISGSLVSDHPCCNIPSYGCSDERTSALMRGDILPDVIMVFMGTNDWGYGVRLKAENDAESSDRCVFSVAYSLMLQKLRKNYPDAEIWCFTPLKTTCKCLGLDGVSPYRYGKHIAKFAAEIREAASNHGCRVFDLLNSSAICDTIEGYHPNAEGMQVIADTVLSML